MRVIRLLACRCTAGGAGTQCRHMGGGQPWGLGCCLALVQLQTPQLPTSVPLGSGGSGGVRCCRLTLVEPQTLDGCPEGPGLSAWGRTQGAGPSRGEHSGAKAVRSAGRAGLCWPSQGWDLLRAGPWTTVAPATFRLTAPLLFRLVPGPGLNAPQLCQPARPVPRGWTSCSPTFPARGALSVWEDPSCP